MRMLYLIIPFILSMAEPVKDKGLKVEVEDKKGVIHHLNGLVCGGRTYLKVIDGNIEYSVEPANLKSIEVISREGEHLRLKLRLKNGTSKEYMAPINTYCKAKSQVGEAGFYLKDVKTIFIKTEDK